MQYAMQTDNDFRHWQSSHKYQIAILSISISDDSQSGEIMFLHDVFDRLQANKR